MILRCGTVFGLALALGARAALAQPATLDQALIAAYNTNPQILAERANLRAVNEGVPKALSGWRPTVVLSGSAGYSSGTERTVAAPTFFSPGGPQYSDISRDTLTEQATVTQPIFQGGKTRASVFQARNLVRAERAQLIATEESVFTSVVSAYVSVIENRQLVAVNETNVTVLQQQLQSSEDRFRVGELTQTDVAQAQAALAQGQAQLETARGNLATALATYVQVVGQPAAAALSPPQPLVLPVKSAAAADAEAAANNPSVVNALFNVAAAKNAVNIAFAALMPSVSVQFNAFRQDNPTLPDTRLTGWAATADLSVPLYQGGGEYATVRQAKQEQDKAVQTLDNARRAAVQQASQAWQTLIAAEAAIISSHAAVAANRIALEGTEREAIVGTATTLDVLTVQQNLLTAETTLVQNLASLITASYGVAAAIGRLTARDLKLPVPYYDENAYYRSVRNALFGVGGPAETGNPTGGALPLPPAVPGVKH
ncbi:MAG: TolC family outer membrane protein [Rhodospirillales bacterium]|nr:TolC family outer membrane protein [Rhodospirillales bacterium]